MSEKSKEEKLATARKLLKQFQQKIPSKTSGDYDTNNTEAKTEVPRIELCTTPVIEAVSPDAINLSNDHISFIANSHFEDNDMNKSLNTNAIETFINKEVVESCPALENVNPNPLQKIFSDTQSKDTFYENFQTQHPIDNLGVNMVFNPSDKSSNMEDVAIKKNDLHFASNNCNDHKKESEVLKKSVVDSVIKNMSELELNYEKLNNILQQEKIKNDTLIEENHQLQVDRDSLYACLQNLQTDAEYITKMKKDVEVLQGQLELHIKTVKVLVGEKTELITQLNKYEQAVKKHDAECEELQGRLRASRHKSSDLEKDLIHIKQIHNQCEINHSTLQEQYNEIKVINDCNVKQSEDMKEEISELKEQIKSLSLTCKRLESEVKEKENDLSISHLKVQQLLSGDSKDLDNWESSLEEKKMLQLKLSELEQNLSKSKNETIQVTQQYKQYCQQLNTQIQTLVTGLQEKANENEKLSIREKELINHMNELEKQLQTSKIRTNSVINEATSSELNNYKAQCEMLEDKCIELNKNLEEKIEEIQLKNQEISACKTEINELEESLETLQANQLDTTKLNAAIESDKIAAARSMAQNADLKQQIEELQRSFIQMSDYKLEITEKLNCEQHLGRELNAQVIKLENELTKLRAVLEAKDEEMIRLQNENTNLSKEILQQSQLCDRLRHYEANDNVTDIVQKELQEAREQISSLTNRNNELENIVSSSLAEVKLPNKYEEGYNVAKRLIRENSSESSDVMETIPENDTPVSMYESRNDVSKIALDPVPVIATQEAMEKLQERFTRTMADIAELTEEKQRLEHLVLQLQSETETVGEYIALYQNQRSLLRQREIEKDNQLQKLAHDQDDMKNKLLKLNQLVVQLLHEREHQISSLSVPNVIEMISDDTKKDSELHATSDEAEVKLAGVVNDKLLNNVAHNNNRTANDTKQSETADKIIELLSELKSSDLIHPYQGEMTENFAHHCHCCSGRLLTV